jgi:uncharacterized membrane protein
MFTLHNVLLFIHVLGAIVWIGAGVTLLLLTRRLTAARDMEGFRALSEQSEFFGPKVFAPSAFVTLTAGIWMVAISPAIGFGDAWIIWGLTGVALSVVFGAVLSERAAAQLHVATQAEPVDPGLVATLQGRLSTYSTIDVVILLSVVWAMVFRPGA